VEFHGRSHAPPGESMCVSIIPRAPGPGFTFTLLVRQPANEKRALSSNQRNSQRVRENINLYKERAGDEFMWKKGSSNETPASLSAINSRLVHFK